MAKRANNEGTIFQRKGDGFWIGRLTVDGKLRQVAAKTQGEVRKKLAGLRKAADQGLPLDTTRQTVEQYLATWLAAAQPTLRFRTFHSYSDLVRLHVVPVLGHHQLAKLGPQHVEAWRNGLLASHLSPMTVLHAWAVLRVALNRAVKQQLVPRNVMLLVDPPKVTTAEIYPLTPEAAASLLAAAAGTRHEHMYALLVATGLRLGEAMALRWDDVDLPGGSLRVRHTLTWTTGQTWQLAEPKSERGKRVVPLIGPASAALRAQKDNQAFMRQGAREAWVDNGLVFTDPLGGPTNAGTVDHDFKKLLKAAGLPLTHRVHDLRHSTATYLLGAGVPGRVVMDILGHSNMAMTHHYQHVLSTMLTDAGTALEAWLAKPAR